MKAISLWQPWATMLVLGTKTMETRSWPTSYRGTLLIHASQHYVKKEMLELIEYDGIHAALHGVGGSTALLEKGRLPYGAIVGAVNLIDCVSTNKIDRYEVNKPHYLPGTGALDNHQWKEADLGNFDRDRFAWVCNLPVQFTKPIEYRGAQGFFDVPDNLLVHELNKGVPA